MAGTYVAETLQWRENCLGYMNSWLGERCVFEKPGVEAGRDRSIVSVHPCNAEGRWMPYIVHLHEAILSIQKRSPSVLRSAGFPRQRRSHQHQPSLTSARLMLVLSGSSISAGALVTRRVM